MPGLGRKVFTAGDVLTASDVQNYMMDQSVMYFAGTAARSSAIATPTTGMTSYIGVTGTATIPQIETYTGSAWQTPYGLTLIASVNLSGVSLTVANAFSATYDAYQLVFSNIRSSAGQNTQLQMGTTATGYYQTEIVCSGGYATASGNAQFSNTNNGAQFTTGIISATTTNEIAGGIVNVVNPFLTTSTIFQSLGVDARPGGLGPRTNTGFHNSATSFTSFTVLSGGGSFTSGTVRVYGLRNS
jgi:Tfp pilus assembly protein FimT